MATVFIYTIFNSADSYQAVRTTVDMQRIKEFFSSAAVLPKNELQDVLFEAFRCMDEVLKGNRILAEAYKDSPLSPELVALYLLITSNNAMNYLADSSFRTLGSSKTLHFVYNLHQDEIKKIGVMERIFPGPQSLADEDIVKSWANFR